MSLLSNCKPTVMWRAAWSTEFFLDFDIMFVSFLGFLEPEEPIFEQDGGAGNDILIWNWADLHLTDIPKAMADHRASQ